MMVKENPDVSVVVLNYNTALMTLACVESLHVATSGVSFEVVVVDNGSGDIARLRSAADSGQFRLVESMENLGFAKGMNLGIEAARGTYVLLLNSDTKLLNNAIAIALRELRSQRDVGVVSARLTSPDGTIQPVCRRFPSILREIGEALRVHRLLPRERRARWLLGTYFDHRTRMEADAVWGTFFMFRRACLSCFPGGRLSETFFMYGEDLEWCYVIRRAGYRIVYVPDANVLHYVAGSGFAPEGEGPAPVIWRNRARFLCKYRGAAYALAFVFARYVNIVLGRSPTRGADLRALGHMLRGWADVVRGRSLGVGGRSRSACPPTERRCKS
jgi:GT2 family glycosyltransferase